MLKENKNLTHEFYRPALNLSAIFISIHKKNKKNVFLTLIY